MTAHDDISAIQRSLTNDFEVSPCETQADLEKKLASRINHLIQADFHRLVAILYRLDINELKLRRMLAENTDQDAGELIASLVIERELQKLRSRRQFRSSHDIPDDEKW